MAKASYVVGQNVGFDINIMGCEFHRVGIQTPLLSMNVLDTCTETTAELLRLPGGRGGKFKLPTLTELHEYLFWTKNLQKLIMQPQTLKQQHVVFGIGKKKFFPR